MFEWSKNNDVLGTANRGNNTESGLCSLCRSDCVAPAVGLSQQTKADRLHQVRGAVPGVAPSGPLQPLLRVADCPGGQPALRRAARPERAGRAAEPREGQERRGETAPQRRSAPAARTSLRRR